jgi:hypothetical protein
MPFDNWRDAVAALRSRLGPATNAQRQLASFLKLDIGADVPALVAAPLLRERLRIELFGPEPRETSEQQLEFLKDLAKQVGQQPSVVSTGALADAWIRVLLGHRALRALEELKLERGDLVRFHGGPQSEVDEVSSLSETGRVNFVGGPGRGAWPNQLEVVARSEDASEDAERLRREVANAAALRAPLREFSLAKQRLLEPFRADGLLNDLEIDELRSLIEVANDERPIQKFLTDHPHVLTALLDRAEARFAIPEVELGNQLRADFFMADVNSLGIRWVLVELESPRVDVTLKTKPDFSKEARNGIGQVRSWREWLQSNLNYARNPQSENGLGLVDIRPETKGLVLVGRRSSLRPNAIALRSRLEETENITVHTYNWLVEVLTDRGSTPWRKVLQDYEAPF